MEERPEVVRDRGGGRGKGPTGRVTVDLLDQPPKGRRIIPVWFFVGVILFIYGVLILATGIYEFSHPPPTVLSSLHPAVWWGALLIIIGFVYVYLFAPHRS